IGAFKEMVFSITRAGEGSPATGTILIDARFERLPVLRKLSLSPAVRLGGVILVSLLCSLLIALVRSVSRRWSGDGQAGQAEQSLEPRLRVERSTWPGPLLGDLVRGVGTVLIALVVIQIYHLGAKGRLDVGWTALGIAVAGAVIAEWWKYGLTRKHLT